MQDTCTCNILVSICHSLLLTHMYSDYTQSYRVNFLLNIAQKFSFLSKHWKNVLFNGMLFQLWLEPDYDAVRYIVVLICLEISLQSSAIFMFKRLRSFISAGICWEDRSGRLFLIRQKKGYISGSRVVAIPLMFFQIF